jgi:dihydroxyacetone kinase
MAGCSISLLRLNERLKHWIAGPAQTPALMQI